MNLDQLLQISALLDFYGGMLTENQRLITRSYIDYNASLAEIAAQNGTTRQAVGDVVRRSVKKLEELESRLNLVKKYNSILVKIPALSKKLTIDAEEQEKISFEFEQLFKTLED